MRYFDWQVIQAICIEFQLFYICITWFFNTFYQITISLLDLTCMFILIFDVFRTDVYVLNKIHLSTKLSFIHLNRPSVICWFSRETFIKRKSDFDQWQMKSSQSYERNSSPEIWLEKTNLVNEEWCFVERLW